MAFGSSSITIGRHRSCPGRTNASDHASVKAPPERIENPEPGSLRNGKSGSRDVMYVESDEETMITDNNNITHVRSQIALGRHRSCPIRSSARPPLSPKSVADASGGVSCSSPLALGRQRSCPGRPDGTGRASIKLRLTTKDGVGPTFFKFGGKRYALTKNLKPRILLYESQDAEDVARDDDETAREGALCDRSSNVSDRLHGRPGSRSRNSSKSTLDTIARCSSVALGRSRSCPGSTCGSTRASARQKLSPNAADTSDAHSVPSQETDSIIKLNGSTLLDNFYGSSTSSCSYKDNSIFSKNNMVQIKEWEENGSFCDSSVETDSSNIQTSGTEETQDSGSFCDSTTLTEDSITQATGTDEVQIQERQELSSLSNFSVAAADIIIPAIGTRKSQTQESHESSSFPDSSICNLDSIIENSDTEEVQQHERQDGSSSCDSSILAESNNTQSTGTDEVQMQERQESSSFRDSTTFAEDSTVQTISSSGKQMQWMQGNSTLRGSGSGSFTENSTILNSGTEDVQMQEGQGSGSFCDSSFFAENSTIQTIGTNEVQVRERQKSSSVCDSNTFAEDRITHAISTKNVQMPEGQESGSDRDSKVFAEDITIQRTGTKDVQIKERQESRNSQSSSIAGDRTIQTAGTEGVKIQESKEGNSLHDVSVFAGNSFAETICTEELQAQGVREGPGEVGVEVLRFGRCIFLWYADDDGGENELKKNKSQGGMSLEDAISSSNISIKDPGVHFLPNVLPTDPSLGNGLGLVTIAKTATDLSLLSGDDIGDCTMGLDDMKKMARQENHDTFSLKHSLDVFTRYISNRSKFRKKKRDPVADEDPMEKMVFV